MATQGPLFPGTTANLSNAGTSENAELWVNPGNIVSDNGTEAQITAATYDSPDISQILVASNFGFSQVSGTVNGITVEIDRRSIIASSGKDFRVQLAKGTTFASLVGTNKAVPATIWPTTSTIATYGSGSDLWGTTWTAAEVAASSFAVFLSCQANIANADVGVDFIRVTVTYTPPAGITSTATWSQAAAGWDAQAAETLTSTATVAQAAASWDAAASVGAAAITATATWSQPAAGWAASASERIAATSTFAQPAAGWEAAADELFAASATFAQSAGSWSAAAGERIPSTATFAQPAAGWSATGVERVTATATFGQGAAGWAATAAQAQGITSAGSWAQAATAWDAAAAQEQTVTAAAAWAQPVAGWLASAISVQGGVVRQGGRPPKPGHVITGSRRDTARQGRGRTYVSHPKPRQV